MITNVVNEVFNLETTCTAFYIADMRRVVFCIMGLLVVPNARAESANQPSVAETRRSGDDRQAEQYELEQWHRDNLSDRERAELAIQLALVYTEQALASSPESADRSWKKAEEICQEFAVHWPENPRAVLVEVQRALVSLARGIQAREQRRDKVQALERLRTAIRQLGELSDRTSRALIEHRLRGRTNHSPDTLTIDELESLEAHLAFHLARAQRQLGLCYAPGSSDHDDALLQAAQRLTPLAAKTPPDDLAWNARAELVECRRALGQTTAAQELAENWLRENPPPEVLKRLSVNATPPATSASASLEKRPHDDDFEKAMAAAAVERSAGQWAAAAERYRQLALQQLHHPRAAETHRLAILQAAEALRASVPTEHAALTDSYEGLLREHLTQWAEQAAADEVRLWLGRLLAARREWQSTIGVLQQVRPQSDVFSASVKLLIECYENQMRELAKRPETSDATTHRNGLLSAATQYLQPIITGPENKWPAEWSELQRDVTLALARLHLRFTDEPSPYAEKLLTAALRGMTKPDSANTKSWRGAAQCLLLVAMVRNGNSAETYPWLDEMTALASVDALMELLAALDRQIAPSSPTIHKQPQAVGQLALGIARRLDARRSELEATALPRLAMYRATALAASGERAAAIAQFGALAGELPNDAEIQERYAILLATANSPEELRQAVSQWQRIESRSRRGSLRWRRARQARIELLTRLGDAAEAEKLQRLTRLLYPDWDSAPVPSP